MADRIKKDAKSKKENPKTDDKVALKMDFQTGMYKALNTPLPKSGKPKKKN